MTATEFSAFVTNQPVLDLQVFSDWLAGRSVADAVSRRLATLRQSPHLLPLPSTLTRRTAAAAAAGSAPPSAPDSPALGPAGQHHHHHHSRASTAIPSHIHHHDLRRHISTHQSQSHPSHQSHHSQSHGSLSRRPAAGSSTPPRTTASSTASLNGSASATFPPPSALVDYPSTESTGGKLSRRGSILLRDIRRAVGSVMLPLSFLSTSSSTGINSSAPPSSSYPQPSTTSAPFSNTVDPLISPAIALSVHLHVIQQFRLFVLADTFLHRPRAFLTQTVIPLPPHMRRVMIRAYYAFDERVMRELLGKKLNSRTRRELDEWVVANYNSNNTSTTGSSSTSSVSGVGMLAARRMLENLKRIMKRTEDVPEGDPVVAVLMDDFALDLSLAKRYAAVHFFTTHRIDTTKRRLAHYTFADLEAAATAFLDHWIRAKPMSSSMLQPPPPLTSVAQSAHDADYGGGGGGAQPDSPTAAHVHQHTYASSMAATGTASGGNTIVDDDTDALAALAADLRDVKSYLLGSKDVVESVRLACDPDRHPPAHVRALIRHLISIGAGLAHAASRRSLLVDIAERVVDSSLAAGVGWGAGELDACLMALAGALVADDRVVVVAPRAAAAWARWVHGVRVAAVRMVARRVGGKGDRESDEEVDVNMDGDGSADQGASAQQ